MPHQITAVAGDVDDLLALVDRLDALLLGWSATVPGRFAGPLERLLGTQNAPLLVDRQHAPERLYVPLTYVHTIP